MKCFFSAESKPYCRIKGETKHSHVSSTPVNPTWNFPVIVYRKLPTEEIEIEIWNRNTIKDDLLGSGFLLAPQKPTAAHDPAQAIQTTLVQFEVKKDGLIEITPAKIKVEFETHDDLAKI